MLTGSWPPCPSWRPCSSLWARYAAKRTTSASSTSGCTSVKNCRGISKVWTQLGFPQNIFSARVSQGLSLSIFRGKNLLKMYIYLEFVGIIYLHFSMSCLGHGRPAGTSVLQNWDGELTQSLQYSFWSMQKKNAVAGFRFGRVSRKARGHVPDILAKLHRTSPCRLPRSEQKFLRVLLLSITHFLLAEFNDNRYRERFSARGKNNLRCAPIAFQAPIPEGRKEEFLVRPLRGPRYWQVREFWFVPNFFKD